MWVYVAYSGWNAATYVAEELRQPARTLPMALGIGTALVTALYLLLNVVFLYAAPLEDMKGQEAVGAFAASRLFGPEIAGIFAGLMALSLMSTVNAMVTVGPRVYYAMAGNGAFPAGGGQSASAISYAGGGDCGAGRLHHADDADAVSSADDVYRSHAERFRRDERGVAVPVPAARPGWQKLRVVSFAYPLFPLLFIMVGIWMTYQGIVLKPYVALATGVTLGTGALVYHLRLRSRTPRDTRRWRHISVRDASYNQGNGAIV